jgi:hypothetical protein
MMSCNVYGSRGLLPDLRDYLVLVVEWLWGPRTPQSGLPTPGLRSETDVPNTKQVAVFVPNV